MRTEQESVPEPFYAVTKDLPPANVAVRISWGDWLGVAKRTRTNGGSGRSWVQLNPKDHSQIIGRVTTRIGNKKDHARLPTRYFPILWAPLNPETWDYELPEPVPTVRRVAQNTERSRRKRWWLAPSTITYSRPGDISEREAEGRLMRALASENSSKIVEGLGMHRLASMRSERKQDSSGQLPFVPSGRDIDDYDVAMSWYTVLCNENDSAAGVLAFSAHEDGSWAALARELSKWRDVCYSRHKFLGLYGLGLNIVTKVANGEITAGVRIREANLRSLRGSRNLSAD